MDFVCINQFYFIESEEGREMYVSEAVQFH